MTSVWVLGVEPKGEPAFVRVFADADQAHLVAALCETLVFEEIAEEAVRLAAQQRGRRVDYEFDDLLEDAESYEIGEDEFEESLGWLEAFWLERADVIGS